MTWSWWYVPIALFGLGLVLAPVIGAAWAKVEMPMPEDQRPRTWQAVWWRWVRGRRSP